MPALYFVPPFIPQWKTLGLKDSGRGRLSFALSQRGGGLCGTGAKESNLAHMGIVGHPLEIAARDISGILIRVRTNSMSPIPSESQPMRPLSGIVFLSILKSSPALLATWARFSG